MSFNLEEYNNLSSNELEKISKDLIEKSKKIQNIILERDNSLTKAINNFDLEGLKKAMSENGNKPFREDTGVGILFTEMKAKDIDFFLYLTSLPEFQKFDKLNYHTALSKTEEAIQVSIKDKELFDFFINNPQYSEKAYKIHEKYSIDKKTDTDVIAELFKREILKPTEEVFQKAIDNKAYNFIEYFIKNKLYVDIKNKSHDVYLKVWNQPFSSITQLIKEEYPNFNKIPFSALVKTLAVSRNAVMPNDDKFDSFIAHPEESYFKVMEDHVMKTDDIHNIISAFSRISGIAEYQALHSFCKFIVEKKPEHIKDIKSCLDTKIFKNRKFISELEMAILNIELTEDLNMQNKKVEPKKLKI